jgi:2'-5' RNA ligase
LSETRSFIAVLLPPELKRDIYQFNAPLQRLPLDIKWVEKENYHLTMKFLGSCTAREINKASNFLWDLTGEWEPFHLQCGELIVFPNWHRPRVISISLRNTENLQNLWYKIEKGLASRGFPEEKRKRFSPHLFCQFHRSGGLSSFVLELLLIMVFPADSCGKRDPAPPYLQKPYL